MQYQIFSLVQYLRNDKRKLKKAGLGRQTIANESMYLCGEFVGLWNTAAEKEHFYTCNLSMKSIIYLLEQE
jgi:hypothetical protein